MARILLVAHFEYRRNFYQGFLDWMVVNLRESMAQFDLALLHKDLRPGPDQKAVVLWLQDPVQAWSERAYANALALQAACDERGVAVVNRVENLTRAGKESGSRLMRECGLRTPRMALITNASEFRKNFLGLPFPLFVREDWGHGEVIAVARDEEEARRIPVERFKRPVAVEMIDVRDPRDGLYRKYRYTMAGDRGFPFHMQVSGNWITRGVDRVFNDQTLQEELAFTTRPFPHHDLFNSARKALGLDFVAFDFALDDPDKPPLVWEANPLPHLPFAYREGNLYRNPSLHHAMALMAALYLDKAGIELPKRLSAYLDGNPEPAGWTVPPKRMVAEPGL